jgi:peroxiredoxin
LTRGPALDDTRSAVPVAGRAATPMGRGDVRVTRSDDIYRLPDGLPVPADDGAALHLLGAAVAALELPATSGSAVSLARLKGLTVVYCYPRTGRPDQAPPPGWNEIPGARGCTPQACGFRDHHAELQRLRARVFGMSTQSTEEQREAVARLHLPFQLLSDADLRFAEAMDLPTFEVNGMHLLKRLTMVVENGVVEQVFYPVFPPDRHAEEVVAWLQARA